MILLLFYAKQVIGPFFTYKSDWITAFVRNYADHTKHVIGTRYVKVNSTNNKHTDVIVVCIVEVVTPSASER